jgi:hypothetical protein
MLVCAVTGTSLYPPYIFSHMVVSSKPKMKAEISSENTSKFVPVYKACRLQENL